MLDLLKVVWYLSSDEIKRDSIKESEIFSTVLQICLADFTKRQFDSIFREISIAAISNFTLAENVRILVHNSLK